MINKSMWSGMALVAAGIIFIAATHTGGRSSLLGMLVGCAIVAMGSVRIISGRGETPPAL